MDRIDPTIDPSDEPTPEECAAIDADVAAGLVYPDCGCGLTRGRMRAAIDYLALLRSDLQHPDLSEYDCDRY